MADEVSPSEFAALEAETKALKANVVRVEGTVDRLSIRMDAGFNDLSGKLSARQQPNWILGGVLVTAMFGLWQGVINPMNNQVSNINLKLDTLSTRFVDRDTMATTLRATGERRDEQYAASIERDKALSATIEKLRDGTVTWQAHDDLRRYFQAQVDMNRNDVSDLRARVGDTFGLRDALQMIGKRLDSLEQTKR